MLQMDTDVTSHLYRDSAVGRRYHRTFLSQHSALAISSVTQQEMVQGAVMGQWSKAEVMALQAYLSTFHVVPLTPGIVSLAKHMREELAREGRVLHVADSLIAATAILWPPADMCLVSHNASDFRHLDVYGLRLLTLPP